MTKGKTTMMTSELIKKLVDAIRRNGDLPVYIYAGGGIKEPILELQTQDVTFDDKYQAVYTDTDPRLVIK